MFMRSLLLLSSVCLAFGAAGCSTSSNSRKQESAPAKATPTQQKPEAKPSEPAPAASTKRPLENKAFQVAGNALVGSWRGKDARSVIGTLMFCADGRAKAEIADNTLGGKGGAAMTWAASEVATGEAKIVLTMTAKANQSPFVMMVKRMSETELVAAASPSGVRVDNAPEKDKVFLVRADTTPNCD